LGKGQGHEHGRCDVARHICEHDLDEILMRLSVWHMPVLVVVRYQYLHWT
jgi:hypothetical protein